MISICIPCYEQHGKSKEYLSQNLNMLRRQTFTDFEVIISDDSNNDDIDNLILDYKDLNIVYKHNSIRLGHSQNTNQSMSMAKGSLIKIIFMDDYLYHVDSLKDIVEAFEGKWLVTACEHTYDGLSYFRPFYPKYSEDIYTGNNTISSPSVLTIKNDSEKLYFNPEYSWLMDCEYYKRCYNKFGEPKILNKINVVNRMSPYQVSNNLSEVKKNEEINRLISTFRC